MKVMNGLVITLEEDKIFLCVWLFYYVSNFADSRTEVPRYRSSFFCLSVFSSSEVFTQNLSPTIELHVPSKRKKRLQS